MNEKAICFINYIFICKDSDNYGIIVKFALRIK